MLPILDFSTVKDEVFPPISSVFSKTSSLSIKVRGLESFVLLCGGSNNVSADSGDGLSGIANESRPGKSGSASILDKYSVQEKIVPLLKAMKTKEPAVMMAALNVFRQVGQIADVEFIALEVLPILWNFSLGPLLNVQQFASFMDLIKTLSSKVEHEHTKKLQSLGSSNDHEGSNSSSFGIMQRTNGSNDIENSATDFENLVLGKREAPSTRNNILNDWSISESNTPPVIPAKTSREPTFSWSSTTGASTTNNNDAGHRNSLAGGSLSNSRSITPDMNLSFPSLNPMNKTQPLSAAPSFPTLQPSPSLQNSTLTSPTPFSSAINRAPINQSPQTHFPSSPFTIPPPPSSSSSPIQNFSSGSPTLNQISVNPALSRQSQSNRSFPIQQPPTHNFPQQQKQGLDKYESLL